MSTKSIEYVADLLPDGHLSIPDKIKKKLKNIPNKKVRVRIELKTERVVKKQHPAFGIWSDRLLEGSTVDTAREFRKKLESREDASG
ncbi:MAG: hypothetical protein E3K37_18705 [Candidatus Kuenenia sp.]|nr:hypothetical protein [Candidatus Kuenenia hertensis]